MSEIAQPVYLRDYRPSPFLIDSVELRFELSPSSTRVKSRLALRRVMSDAPRKGVLVLDGDGLILQSVHLDGRPLEPGEYYADDRELRVGRVPDACVLEVETRLNPSANTHYAGLFRPRAVYCTQCEAENFRRITFYLDRPDVLSRFTVTVVADPAENPVLLSNGNLVNSGRLPDGRHWAQWMDPFPKPAYLFALVAGKLDCAEDEFVTRSGRRVRLRIYVDPGRQKQCAYALQCLKQAMAWEEAIYGLEYDLDTYHIAALEDFPAGAMENKGLNIFAARTVLADATVSTDADRLTTQAIIAHEYLHNWTGNRVTCRDWFQLSVKEGLTVFRTQQFAMAHQHTAVRRIRDVRMMLDEFRQAAGPLAHPVQPKRYFEISNFYTFTVYDKGAHLFYMLSTMLGEAVFTGAIRSYLSRYDGKATTIEDLLVVIAESSGRDLTQFAAWYEVIGTPCVAIRCQYDAARNRATLSCSQELPASSAEAPPLVIPISLGFLDESGRALCTALEGDTAAAPAESHLIVLTQAMQSFHFSDVASAPVVSAFRGFTAPVVADLGHSTADLALLAVHDRDHFDRWWWTHCLRCREWLALALNARTGTPARIMDSEARAVAAAIELARHDPLLASECLSPPSAYEIADFATSLDIELVAKALELGIRATAERFATQFLELYETHRRPDPRGVDAKSIGARSLKALSMRYLLALEPRQWGNKCLDELKTAETLSEALGAFSNLVSVAGEEREAAIDYAFRRWAADRVIVNKLREAIGLSRAPDALDLIVRERDRKEFDFRDAGAVRALLLSFADQNLLALHSGVDTGYELLFDAVRRVDPLNPNLAARLLGKVVLFQRLNAGRQRTIVAGLEVLAKGRPSRNVAEMLDAARMGARPA